MTNVTGIAIIIKRKGQQNMKFTTISFIHCQKCANRLNKLIVGLCLLKREVVFEQ